MLSQLYAIHPDHWSKPFWDAAARHELVCQKCTNCGTMRVPPGPFCWNCRSQECAYPLLPGTGTIFTYSTTHFSASPTAVPEEELPYTVVVVALDEAPGCRLMGVLVRDDAGKTVEISQPVQVSWEDTPDGTSMPRWTLDTF